MRSHRISLYEFMPYGAPELLESARRNMAGAVVAGIGFWTVVAALAIAAGMILSRNVREIEIPIPRIADFIPYQAPPSPPSYVPPAARSEPTPSRLQNPNDPPLPVPDPVAPIEPHVGQTGQTGPITNQLPPGEAQPGNPAAPERLPLPDEPIYVDREPVAITEVKPVYPTLPQEAGVDGLVIVRVLVGKNGRVLDALVLPRYSIPMLDGAALEAARRWVFEPAMVNDHPVAVWVTIPMRFKLH